MNPSTLQGLSLKTIANTRKAAEQAVQAYCNGVRRLLETIDAGGRRAIETGAGIAVAQVNRVAERAAGLETPLLANGIEAAARASLPGARVALTLSERLAAGTDQLSARIAGAPRAERAVRSAKKAAAPVVKAVRKTTARAGHKVTAVKPRRAVSA
ncbi:MAG: hypothetical protein KGL18_00165 [Burkholderiales bacterium]|nr:hypothetical protein [Burkholderiales bacterium]MDE1929684.1 hypothetical protein [Burkholderiales bacterium]MDE2160597.1 hypothetical protein [Burkholderiales bacterium]MDE2501375.1 hypothetical protein [Burkholderiales bacterium]